MGLDRPLLRATPGLRSGSCSARAAGRTMTLSADLRRWALFAVWGDEAGARRVPGRVGGGRALGALAAEALPRAPRAAARARARGAGGALRRRGRRPPPDGAPVAILTRATIRPARLVPFYRSILPPAARLVDAPGLLASVGIGEWPLARQATFSLWRSWDDAAPTPTPTARTARWCARTRDERWYSEELFARFRPYGARAPGTGATRSQEQSSRNAMTMTTQPQRKTMTTVRSRRARRAGALGLRLTARARQRPAALAEVRIGRGQVGARGRLGRWLAGSRRPHDPPRQLAREGDQRQAAAGMRGAAGAHEVLQAAHARTRPPIVPRRPCGASP